MINETHTGFTFDAKLAVNSFVVAIDHVDARANCFQIRLMGHIAAGVHFSCGSKIWTTAGRSFPRVAQLMVCIQHLSPQKLNVASLLFLSDSLSSWTHEATNAKTEGDRRGVSMVAPLVPAVSAPLENALADTIAVA